MQANPLLGPFEGEGPSNGCCPHQNHYVPCHINNRYINSYNFDCFAGSHVVHVYYRPLEDLQDYVKKVEAARLEVARQKSQLKSDQWDINFWIERPRSDWESSEGCPFTSILGRRPATTASPSSISSVTWRILEGDESSPALPSAWMRNRPFTGTERRENPLVMVLSKFLRIFTFFWIHKL